MLSILFDKVFVRTYFKERPKGGTFLGLSESNKPIRQEVLFPGQRGPIVLKECQFEKFGDGAVAWAFKLDLKFSREGQMFSSITTAIIDDPVSHNDEYRYSLWK